MKYKFLSIIIVLISINSCKNSKQESCIVENNITYENINYTDIKKQTIKIPISDNLYNVPYLYQVINTDTGDIYVNYNPSLNALELFNLSKQKFIKQIILEKDGPNKILGFDSFNFISEDSILFQLTDYNMFVLYNSTSKTLQKLIINNENISPVATSGIEMKYYKNRIITGLFHARYDFEDFNKEIKPLLLSYNLKQKRIDTMYCNYPVNYKHKYLAFLNTPYIDINKTYTFVSFPFSHNLYVYKSNHLNRIIEFKSKYIDKFPTTHFTYDDEFTQAFLFFFTETPYYTKIRYNKYNNKIYKVVKHEQDPLNSNGKINGRYAGNWSLIILDISKLTINEIKFPKKMYNYTEFFITKNGVAFFSNKTTDSTLIIDEYKI